MRIKKLNLILMIFCTLFLLNQIINMPDHSLNNFVWISIACNIIVLLLLSNYYFNTNFLYIKKIIIIVIIISLYMSAGTWILKYDMHGYITNGENINAYVEYENVTKLPLEICKVISLEGKNTERLERVCVENNENTYKVNTYVKTKRIEQVDSISNIIIFKLFKLIPLVKITKVTYRL